MRKMFLVEFKRGIHSVGFYLSVIMLIITGFLNIGETLESIRGVGVPVGEVRCFVLFFHAMWSEALCYLIPVAVTLVLSASYLEDVHSGMFKYVLVRTQKNCYLWSKVLNCALFGVLTVLIAVIVMLLGFMIMYPINMVEIEYLKMQTVTYYTNLFGRAVVLLLNGSLYASLGGVVGTITNNKYMVYAAPFIFYYVVSTLFSAYLFDYPLLNPKEWMMMNSSSVFIVLGIVLILNIIVILAYFKGIERRWRHD